MSYLFLKNNQKSQKNTFFSQNSEWSCISFIKFEYFEDMNYQNVIWEKVRVGFSGKIITKNFSSHYKKTIDGLFIFKKFI